MYNERNMNVAKSGKKAYYLSSEYWHLAIIFYQVWCANQKRTLRYWFERDSSNIVWKGREKFSIIQKKKNEEFVIVEKVLYIF